jgi:multimeric flavodoxin WrbA
MPLKVLAIAGSPRRNGNSDLLLAEAARGAREAGAEVETVELRKVRMSPCVECNACYRLGRCRIDDAFQPLFEKTLEADRLICSTPVFFMSVPAQAKIFIDRFQCLWSRKYVLKEPLFEGGDRDRRALVIAVGGSRSRKMFDCIEMTWKYFFDVLETTYWSNLWVNRVDDKGEVVEKPAVVADAFRLGADLVSAPREERRKPKSTEHFAE